MRPDTLLPDGPRFTTPDFAEPLKEHLRHARKYVFRMGMRPDPITRAIQKAGSVKALAEVLGIKPQGISQWKNIPVEHVRKIEAATGIPRHELRPDIWDAAKPEVTAFAAGHHYRGS